MGTAAIQVIFCSAIIISLFVFLFSDRARAGLRDFISKPFLENKYDYRGKWLRFIDTLTSPQEELPSKKRGIKSLAGAVLNY